MKSLKDFIFKNKRVLVRCDFNVPIDERGQILDDAKIQEALPTLKYLIENRAKIIIVTHLGEPEGKIVDGLRLNKIRDRLEKLLDVDIMKSFDCIGRDVENQASRLKMEEILLLENVRFHKGETENNLDFAKKLSLLADIYINEAFDVCHRNHASVTGITQFLPHGAGFALEKEVKVLSQIMSAPVRPMVAIIGGAKVSTKALFVHPFCAFADVVIVNGLIKQELIAKKIPLEYPEKVLGPKDNLKGLDLTAEDIKKITSKIVHAKTVFWNGPFGKLEDKKYTTGTLAIANAIIESKAFSVVGGGETIEFLKKEGILDKFSHVSTAGGAMLEFLSGQKLPGLEALKK
ncbi:MAG: phosphoglycerate kinase [Candidatus Staskawiczbacteria bacterium]|nr:phosphoglycerate kinase [Candidatus Staskawiczbacteria bacterium]